MPKFPNEYPDNTDGAELTEYAAALAPLLDKGAEIVSRFNAVIGGGARLQLRLSIGTHSITKALASANCKGSR